MMATKILVVFYSTYGHVYELAKEIAAGSQEVEGVEVKILQVPELMPEETLKQIGADKARAAFAYIPIAEPDDLRDADAIIFGTPPRFGNMAAQMRNFLDRTGPLWFRAPSSARLAACSSPPQHSMAGTRPPSPAFTPRYCTTAWS
jgi:NAD(P)H dehydrogenase (quinone)